MIIKSRHPNPPMDLPIDHPMDDQMEFEWVPVLYYYYPWPSDTYHNILAEYGKVLAHRLKKQKYKSRDSEHRRYLRRGKYELSIRESTDPLLIEIGKRWLNNLHHPNPHLFTNGKFMDGIEMVEVPEILLDSCYIKIVDGGGRELRTSLDSHIRKVLTEIDITNPDPDTLQKIKVLQELIALNPHPRPHVW